jgi:hypothetical protein
MNLARDVCHRLLSRRGTTRNDAPWRLRNDDNRRVMLRGFSANSAVYLGKHPSFGGRSGIRTHERVAPLTVFKTVAFVRSAILPQGGYVTVWSRHDNPE